MDGGQVVRQRRAAAFVAGHAEQIGHALVGLDAVGRDIPPPDAQFGSFDDAREAPAGIVERRFGAPALDLRVEGSGVEARLGTQDRRRKWFGKHGNHTGVVQRLVRHRQGLRQAHRDDGRQARARIAAHGGYDGKHAVGVARVADQYQGKIPALHLGQRVVEGGCMHDRPVKFARDLRHDGIDGGVRADEQDTTTGETVGAVIRSVQHAPGVRVCLL